MSRSGTSKRRSLDRRGATALEFGAAAPVFLMLLLTVFEGSRYHFVSESLHHFVGEVARAAMINPASNPEAQMDALLRKAPVLRRNDFKAFNVEITRATAPSPTTVRVSASYKSLTASKMASELFPNLFKPTIDVAIELRFLAPAPGA